MRFKRVIIVACTFAVVSAMAFGCVQVAVGAAAERIATIEELSSAPAVIVLGASVHPNGDPSDVLEDRLLTALDVYQAGKAEKFIVSGDNGQEEYDEVNAMREYLLAHDVPPEDIFLDHAGFDTYDSMYRANAVFGLQEAIVVTQQFHLPRALYIGGSLGMDVQGVVADRRRYLGRYSYAVRESVANVKAVINILLNSKPKFLGDAVSIDGDGRVTWDEGK